MLVEVAVEDAALPVDADGVATHEVFDGGGVEVFDEKLVVFCKLFVALQVRGVTGDSHVGDAVEFVEFDVEVFLHLALVVGFEGFLLGRKKGSVGVVYEIESEVRINAVAEFVEFLKGGDGAVKDAVAALLVYVVRRIARHGGDADDFVLGVKLGNPFVAGFFNNGGVEAGHDFARLVEGANAFDECLEVWVHLGGSSSEVDGGDVGGFEPVESAVEVVTGDELFAVWASIYMAVDAGDVTEFAEVELENLRRDSGE